MPQPLRFAALLGLSLIGLSPVGVPSAAAQTAAPPAPTPRSADAFLGTATYRLWDGDAPGANGSATNRSAVRSGRPR